MSQVYNVASKMAVSVGSDLANATTITTTKRHAIRKILPVHPERLFNIIVQVDAYSSFLPLCTYSRILRTSPCKTSFDATLKVGITSLPPPIYSMEEEYTSRVIAKHSKIINPNTNQESLLWTVDTTSIQSKYLDYLKSQWKLQPVIQESHFHSSDNTRIHMDSKLQQQEEPQRRFDGNEIWTDVDFYIEMSISDPILTVLLDQILKDVANRQVIAFEKRCHEIYPFYNKNI